MLSVNSTRYKVVPHHICIDDVRSQHYNTIQTISPTMQLNSFEFMRRDDNQYKYTLVMHHNQEAIKGDGSCIFLHVSNVSNGPTAGCTSMQEAEIVSLIAWLDKTKNPLILQTPKKQCLEFERNI